MSARYRVEIRHRRHAPVRHDVRMRSDLWLVDLDDLPRTPRWARHLIGFLAGDHLGEPNRSIRANLDAFLAGAGVDLRGGRVRMLTSPRAWGYVFNPLSLFWCHDATGALACVVAEVSNTYGGRHLYLVRPDASGRCTVSKEFLVSPFYPVDGWYRMYLPEPAEQLRLVVRLQRPGDSPFTATVRGQRTETEPHLLRWALRRPLRTLRVRAEITRHGVTLWAKGVPVVPRRTVSAARHSGS